MTIRTSIFVEFVDYEIDGSPLPNNKRMSLDVTQRDYECISKFLRCRQPLPLTKYELKSLAQTGKIHEHSEVIYREKYLIFYNARIDS